MPKRERMERGLILSAEAWVERATAVSRANAGDLTDEGAHRILERHGSMAFPGRHAEAFLQAGTALPPDGRTPASFYISAFWIDQQTIPMAAETAGLWMDCQPTLSI